MKWKTFFQIVLLIFIAGAITYIVFPKYYFSLYGKIFIKSNKITGKVMAFHTGKDAKDKPTKLKRGWITVK